MGRRIYENRYPNIWYQRRKLVQDKSGKLYQNLPCYGGNIRQNATGFFIMPNIHQIHDIIQKCKCKYIFTEKENLAPPKFERPQGALLSKLLQLFFFREQPAD
jgi:hypothetical protein